LTELDDMMDFVEKYVQELEITDDPKTYIFKVKEVTPKRVVDKLVPALSGFFKTINPKNRVLVLPHCIDSLEVKSNDR